MQTTYMTIQALQVAARHSAEAVARGSKIRVAAVAQPEPGRGKWYACRLDWSDEPARAVEFITNGLPPARQH